MRDDRCYAATRAIVAPLAYATRATLRRAMLLLREYAAADAGAKSACYVDIDALCLRVAFCYYAHTAMMMPPLCHATRRFFMPESRYAAVTLRQSMLVAVSIRRCFMLPIRLPPGHRAAGAADTMPPPCCPLLPICCLRYVLFTPLMATLCAAADVYVTPARLV